MYTELVCAFELKRDTPESVITILTYMCEGKGKELREFMTLPNHELFKTARWEYMLNSDSYYFDGRTNSIIRYDDISRSYFVTIRCNLKNYDSEIQKFIDWIKPYIYGAGRRDKFIGYYRCEENRDPTLIYI